MSSASRNLRVIDALREMYPGDWNFKNKTWRGEMFSVRREKGRYVRVDNGQEIEVLGKRDKKSKKNLLTDVLSEKYGGSWEKVEWAAQWKSKDHEFYIYRGSIWRDKKTVPVYRRSDTSEIIFEHSSNVRV